MKEILEIPIPADIHSDPEAIEALKLLKERGYLIGDIEEIINPLECPGDNAVS